MCSQGGGVAVYYGGTADFTGCYIYDNDASYVRLGPYHSMAPMEDVSRKCPSRSQGGGVSVYAGTATFTNCEIFENTASSSVCLCPAPFHGPHGSSFQEVSHALAGRWRVRQRRHSQHLHQL